MPYLDTRGIRTHYIREGRGRDLIMIHGLLENLAVWHLSFAPLLRDSFRVTTYDLRGHGYSGMTPGGYTPAELAADLKALMDAAGIESAVLVGRSFGADVALQFCAEFPQRVSRLVAIEPALVGGLACRGDEAWGGWTYWSAQLEEAGRPPSPEQRADLQYLVEQVARMSFYKGPFGQTPRNQDKLLRLIRDTALLNECGEVLELTRSAVARIATPTLLIYGALSPFQASLAFLRHALPDCRVVMVEGAGHLKPAEAAGQIWPEIRRFLGQPLERSADPVAGVRAPSLAGRER
jgi:pimeloyl-ACP methyl ester carboxylesterase